MNNGLKKKIKELKKTHKDWIEYESISIGYQYHQFIESVTYNSIDDKVWFPSIKFNKDCIHVKISRKNCYTTYNSIMGIELKKINNREKLIKRLLKEFQDKREQVFS